ncbi:protein MAIN-LIKE 1-like [Arachis stenosperma]|uniref:protein MAIN-LIKE 1-like n=1 Tax=Arachis stenosperma TaxID=217475 RepID=UPI0025AC1573|nr:protein MAIN-LIKE 1-like [Arachis stenosperma]
MTLEDVAMQLELSIDGEHVTGTLRAWSKFHQRDICQWCQELSDVPAGHVGTTKFNIKLKWLRNRLQQMSLNLQDNALIQYACCYILYLLEGMLLLDKANNTVHVRYLLLLADNDAISTYSWGSVILCWLYRAMYLARDYSVKGMAGCHMLLVSWIYYRLPFRTPNVTTPYSFSLATRVPTEFLGHPHGDFYTVVVPLIFFRWIEILNVDRVLRQFGGKQGPPNPPLNIDIFHRQSACNDDGWWPVHLSAWFEVWANRCTETYHLRIDRADTLRPS